MDAGISATSSQPEFITVSEARRRHWQRRLATEAEAIQRRRLAALAQAEVAAARLLERWPGLGGIWIFGSAVGEAFASHSDIDLAVEGLPLPAGLSGQARRASRLLRRQPVLAVSHGFAGVMPVATSTPEISAGILGA